MKTSIIILLTLCSVVGVGQKGITFVRVGSECLIDSAYEKVIGKEFKDFEDGSESGIYYKVEYDYGEPPPDYFDMVKMYFNGDSLLKGWAIKFKEGWYLHGDTEGIIHYEIEASNNKSTFFHKMYCYDMVISYGGGLSININQQK